MKFIFFFLTCSLSYAADLSWNLNDVSILFKLPGKTSDRNSQMLSPGEIGTWGKIVPYNLYEILPPLDNAGSGQKTMYEKDLKLVSIRIDPCPNTFDQKKCSPEIRLIWQPVVFDIDQNEWVANDATLHTFYKLSNDQFSKLASKLAQFKKENQKLGIDTTLRPLDIHPSFLSNYQDQANANIKKIILETCGETNIYKLTFMSLLTRNVWWRFGGIELKNKKWETIIIPRLNISFVDIFNNGYEEIRLKNNPGKAMDGIFNILPESYPVEDDLTSVINMAYRYNDERDKVNFKDKISALDRMTNPFKTNPTNLDCASCHFVDNTRYYINDRFSDLKNYQSKDFYKNPNPKMYNQTNLTMGNQGTRLVRAFGYFYERSSVNSRVINDSIETAEWMNKFYQIK